MANPAQPPSFGCAFLVVAVLASFLFGLGGAVLGNKVFEPKAQRGATNGGQTIAVQESSAQIEAAKKVSPAVVSLTTASEVNTFLGPIEQKGGGTGFIITNDGLIATNKHVVQSARSGLTVVTNDGKTYAAEVKSLDPTLDFALIKVDAKNLPVVSLGDSNSLQVGQQVIAVGNALGEFQNTVTAGVISAKERSIQAGGTEGAATDQLENLLQTDAAINPGNSGGPLVNLAGQVVGVNTAVAGGAQGIGFAIPVNQVKAAIESYQQKGKISRASLGVRFVTVTKEVASLNKLPVDTGALVTGGRGAPAVLPGSPAAAAGIREGDIIVAVDATRLDANNTLSEIISEKAPGSSVELTYLRDGQEQKVRVTLGER